MEFVVYVWLFLIYLSGVSSQSVTITEDTVYIMNNVVGQVTCTLNGNCGAIVWYLSSIPTPVASTFIGYSCLNTTNGYYQTCDEENHKYTLYFTATTNLHGKTIRCSAEGCTSQQNVSDIVTIFVIVPVPSVALEGISSHQITVTAAESKSITCVTGASRPAPRTLWYIGVTNVTSLSTETQIPSQELFYTRSNLTFIPTKSQNGLQINCKAYNTDNNMVELLTKPTLNVQYANWTLIGSSEFAVTGESFTLICNPHDNNFLALAIYWKRLDIDANGTFRAVVDQTGCKIGPGYDTQYQYTCEPGPLYKLTIPANMMTNGQNNIKWRCGSIFGGAEAYFTITVAIPVSSLSLHADNTGNQQVNVMYENIPKAFHCITNGCRPQANVTVNTTGVTKGQLAESITQNGDLMITRVSQVITVNRGGSAAKTLQCLAVNIQGRQPITSQLITLNVYYIPSVEPTLIGYINGTILYEGDSDLKLTCQQSGGYPRSVITWSCDRKAGTTNNSHTVARSYVQLTVNRNLNRKTCTCNVRHPDNNLAYTRTLSVTFTVYFPPTTPTLQTLDTSFPWIENTQGVLRCIITPGNPPQTTYEWIENSLVINGQTTDTYTIPTLSNVHNGLRIQCRVSNKYTVQRPPAKVSNVTVLDVQYKPIISLSNRMVVVAEGQDVEIICSAIGNPTPIVNWHRENSPYAFGTETSAALALERAKRNDTGIYKCKASTRENSENKSQIFISEESIKIYVFYFTINKATPVCSSSDSISISCCSVNNYSKPLKFYGWKHRMGNTTVRSLEGKLSTMNYNTLSIDYCGYYDSGIYTCEAAVDLHNNNIWYSFSSSIELVVTAPPVVSSNMLDTDVNKKRKMFVEFYSVPKPDIVEWIKDGEKLTLSNKYQQITSVKNVTLLFYEKTVVVKGYESSMSIVNLVESDFGTYTFRVQNSKGSAQVKLKVDPVSGNEAGVIVGGVIGFIVIISIILVAVCVFKRRKKRQNCESVSKDQISDIKHESNNGENNSYQDVDIQMYEELDATNKNKSQYDTLQEQRITCDTQQ